MKNILFGYISKWLSRFFFFTEFTLFYLKWGRGRPPLNQAMIITIITMLIQSDQPVNSYKPFKDGRPCGRH